MAKTKKMNFQEMILALQQYWADQGCVIWQPYHTEVGAGTMNPGTFLRVLGPEPWWAAYLEPCIRPADGRYGENPNRWQHYYQFQVVLKPDPGNPQELYLNSLVALGIDPAEHDIRFVEDNWESPALGAWGLGWEVWLDGQEITQFTYFQQSGQRNLDMVAVEITYGVERILLALQGVDNFLQIQWNDRLTYGDIHLQGEEEFSRYNFEQADVDRLRTLYDEFEAEARNCLQAGLVLPALDYVLKCSHVFNLLDSRGAVGVTERAALFGRMRELSRNISDAFYAQREQAGFPWKKAGSLPSASADPVPGPPPTAPEAFLLEIGSEELPPSDLVAILAQLEERAASLLAEARLAYESLRVFGTPRRQILSIQGLEAVQTDSVDIVKGPPAERAFYSDGKPTKAAIGFAASKGISVDDLRVEEFTGGKYVVAEIRQEGLPADAVLKDVLPNLIGSLTVPRSMRWNATRVTYSRPIRWLLALHGGHVVPLTYAGLESGRTTRLLRFDEPAELNVSSADDYFDILRKRGVLLDLEERRRSIKKQINTLAADVGGKPLEDTDLLTEVANLVEVPTALMGSFDEAYLDLPRAVLISVMEKHQRYFPVLHGEKLLPYFIAVRNGSDEHLDIVRHGNEQVIKARFADARYFFQRDLGRALEDFLPRLKTLAFQEKLGSMYEKMQRLEALSSDLSDFLQLDHEEKIIAQRAARLAKADLGTSMVVEMTSLQGEMGRVYALRSGESEGVANAIFEHYLPRSYGDVLPASRPGLVLSIADRLDSLVGLFAAGIEPTGTRDPFALRRSAIGLIQILVGMGLRFDLREGLKAAAIHLPIEMSEEARQACLAFILAREQGLLLAEGFSHDAVEAVLQAQGYDPAGVRAAVESLEAWRSRSDWLEILQAYARCRRITRGVESRGDVVEALLQDPAEKELYDKLRSVENQPRPLGSMEAFMQALESLVPAITGFFDDVMVMAEDEALRRNRLALLQRIVSLSDDVVLLDTVEGF
ncbi:MAG: glycine--tRNA ligase subunit beta [Anaerolineales bacterium]|nr:glycine--tRNA ligase subunit beta [Anaerolineales bacterium]